MRERAVWGAYGVRSLSCLTGPVKNMYAHIPAREIRLWYHASVSTARLGVIGVFL